MESNTSPTVPATSTTNSDLTRDTRHNAAVLSSTTTSDSSNIASPPLPPQPAASTPPKPVELEIIPPEDPQQSEKVPDEDILAEGNGDGLGQEDGDEIEEGVEVEEDPNECPPSTSATTSPIAKYVMDDFHAWLAELEKRDRRGVPNFFCQRPLVAKENPISCNVIRRPYTNGFPVLIVAVRLIVTRLSLALAVLLISDSQLNLLPDNISDKPFLEAAFPSLRKGVIPVDKYGHLVPYVLPSHVQIHTRRDEAAINNTLSTIIDDLPVDETQPDLVIGFDCEWNVSISDNGSVFERGQIAIIQIAYQDRVFILQVI
ncbi:hypothetical protein CVT24_007402 [Panaeolus cyanescens]|uniref:3'-5' exonuclease domain-containing protein n=1 Tax=Panaeolus cyanescens TaxID=181874 RepID=A0A409W9U7_9AGAR|nr:hypothetical protein CVT24_007402 [Panaeolus cyanescens]